MVPQGSSAFAFQGYRACETISRMKQLRYGKQTEQMALAALWVQIHNGTADPVLLSFRQVHSM
jgi:hypothetical protein